MEDICDKKSPGEMICKMILQKFYPGKTFIKSHPDWLISEKDPDIHLELDLYNNSLKLAVEYQGWIHYKQGNKSKEHLRQIQKRDKYKRKICEKNGVILIQVPYNLNYKEPHNIYNFLRNKLKHYEKMNENLRIDDEISIKFRDITLVDEIIEEIPDESNNEFFELFPFDDDIFLAYIEKSSKPNDLMKAIDRLKKQLIEKTIEAGKLRKERDKLNNLIINNYTQLVDIFHQILINKKNE